MQSVTAQPWEEDISRHTVANALCVVFAVAKMYACPKPQTTRVLVSDGTAARIRGALTRGTDDQQRRQHAHFPLPAPHMVASPDLNSRDRDSSVSPVRIWTPIACDRQCTHHDTVAEDGVNCMYNDLGHVRGLGDVGEERCGPTTLVAVVNEAPDKAREAERDVDGGEGEHKTCDPEDEARDLAGGAAEAGDVQVGYKETEVDSWSVGERGVARRSAWEGAYHRRESRDKWL